MSEENGGRILEAYLVSDAPVDVITSTLRRTLTSHHSVGPGRDTDGIARESEYIAPTYDQIVARRGAMKWLPSHPCNNDLVYGMWWFVWGSVLATIMPAIPLATYEEMHPDSVHNSNLDEESHLITYVLLMVVGLFYSVGSYALKRAVNEPPQKPIFGQCFSPNCHFGTDELFGSWCFLIGTVAALPIVCVMSALDPSAVQYYIAILFLLFACGICAVFCYSCYPSRIASRKEILKPLLQRYGCMICCCASDGCPFERHFANDVLISAWLFLLGCLFITILSALLFVWAIATGDANAMFDFGIGTFDMLLFVVGSAYFVAGAYPSVVNEGSAADENRFTEL
jgi:drug/metabolite transporter (DMT)-like permease